MRRLKGGLIILSAFLSLASLALLIRSMFANDVVEYVSGNGAKTIFSLITWKGKLSYRTLASPQRISWQPDGWYCYAADDQMVAIPAGNTRLGFEATEDEFGLGGAIRAVRISIPLLLPFIVFAIPAAIWWFRRRQYPGGHCQRCGYDLRETPERCPECGAAAEAAK